MAEPPTMPSHGLRGSFAISGVLGSAKLLLLVELGQYATDEQKSKERHAVLTQPIHEDVARRSISHTGAYQRRNGSNAHKARRPPLTDDLDFFLEPVRTVHALTLDALQGLQVAYGRVVAGKCGLDLATVINDRCPCIGMNHLRVRLRIFLWRRCDDDYDTHGFCPLIVTFW